MLLKVPTHFFHNNFIMGNRVQVDKLHGLHYNN